MLEDEILKEIEKNAGSNNDIVIDDVSEDTLYDGVKIESNEKKKKVKKDSKWSKFSKKKKIIIISIIVFLILLISGVLLYIFVFKKDEVIEEKPNIIVEKDNYRYENGTLVLLDGDKEIGTYECKNKDVLLCNISHYSTEDNFDTVKSEYLDGTKIKEEANVLVNRYAFINDTSKKDEENVVVYDMVKKEVINTYKLVKKLNDKEVILKNELDKYGVVSYEDNSETIKVEFLYDYLGVIEDNKYLVAKVGDKSLILDESYKEITKKLNGDIKNFSTVSKRVSIVENGIYYLSDFNNNRLLNDKVISYITFNENNIFLISESKMYIYNNELNALTYDGIRFSGTSYNTLIKYDKNLKQVEKTEDIIIKNEDNNIILKLNDKDEVVINSLEGIISYVDPLVSYYDGTLYIYKDNLKQDLIGSYKCNNKNELKKKDDVLNNCNIAKESALIEREMSKDNIGYLPVYNKKFVFIQDGDKVILWDLQNGEKKATYKSVDTGYRKTDKTLKFVDTINTPIVAVNTSDSLGVIAITKSDVEGVIQFKNDNVTNNSIKFLYDNYLIKRSDSTYHLYSNIGKEITNPDTLIKYEIVDYKNGYLKVLNDSLNYLIYGVDGKIVSNEYKYISFHGDNFVGINEKNEINVFKLSDGLKGLIKETVKVTNTKYEESYIYKEDSIIVDGKTYKWSK